KWGRSELVILRRRRPSGIPDERREIANGPDPTWAADIQHFEAMAATGVTSCENDLWLSRTVQAAAAARLEGCAGAGPPAAWDCLISALSRVSAGRRSGRRCWASTWIPNRSTC